jgi:hypothetical protein
MIRRGCGSAASLSLYWPVGTSRACVASVWVRGTRACRLQGVRWSVSAGARPQWATTGKVTGTRARGALWPRAPAGSTIAGRRFLRVSDVRPIDSDLTGSPFAPASPGSRQAQRRRPCRGPRTPAPAVTWRRGRGARGTHERSSRHYSTGALATGSAGRAVAPSPAPASAGTPTAPMAREGVAESVACAVVGRGWSSGGW